MNAYEQEVKAVYEGLAQRPLTDTEVADVALTLRQFAAFLIECGRDEDLRAKLGVAPSAAPRAINCTTQTDGQPLREPLPAKTDPPTGAPLHDVSAHRESSASLPELPPLPPLATTQVNPHVSAGATVDGSL